MRKVFAQEQRWTKLNCTTNEYVEQAWCGGLFRPEPNEEVISEFMQFKGINDENVARKYFNKSCCECGKNVRQADVIGMNLKLHDRTMDKIYCKKCLSILHNISNDEWTKMVRSFKDQGCNLF